MKIYKVKDKTTGKYYAGGSYGKLTTHGKTWSNIGHLKNALNNLNTTMRGSKINIFLNNLDNWVVEEYELIFPTKECDILEFVSDGDPKKQYDILSNSHK